jgi:hypothetical protein
MTTPKNDKNDSIEALEQKAHARHEIFLNIMALVHLIKRFDLEGWVLPDEVQRALQAIAPIEAALREYFKADEELDIRQAPSLTPYIQRALELVAQSVPPPPSSGARLLSS